MRDSLQSAFPWIAAAACAVATLAGAVTDSRTGRIPNTITLPLIAGGLLTSLAAFGVEGLQFSLLGAAACFLLPYLMFRAGGMGGGDVKLLAGLGAFLGMRLGLEAQLAAMCLGAVWAMFRLGRAGKLRGLLLNSFRVSTNWMLPAEKRAPLDASASEPLRLGIPIFCGTVAVLGLRALGGAR